MLRTVLPFAAPSADPASAARGGAGVAEALRAIVGEALVVGIGEAAHSVAEVQAVQELVVRALLDGDERPPVERGGRPPRAGGGGAEAENPAPAGGIAVVALESGFAEALELDDWVGGAGSDADLAAVAGRGMTYGFGASPIVQRLLAGIRELNRRADGHRVRVVGLDLPGSATSPGPAVRVCLSAVPAQPGDAELLRRTDLGGRTEAAVAVAALSEGGRRALETDLRGVVARVLACAGAGGNDPERAGDPDRVGLAERAAASIEAFLEELACGTDGPPSGAPYPRERFMAETALWAAERYGRTVVLAHNAHVRREALHGRPTLGGMLAERLGDGYRAVATTYGRGPAVRFVARSDRPFDCDVHLAHRGSAPGSVDAALERTLPDPATSALLVDLRACGAPGRPESTGETDSAAAVIERALAAATGIHAGAELDPVEDVATAFDAIVHLREAHRVPGAFERLRAEFAAGRRGPEPAIDPAAEPVPDPAPSAAPERPDPLDQEPR